MAASRADRLLCCAVAYKTAEVESEPIPPTFDSEQDAIDSMMRALWFEARESMKDSIAQPDEAYMHPVDIETPEPGIVTSKTKSTEIMRRKTPLPRVIYEKKPQPTRQQPVVSSPPKSLESAASRALAAERKAIAAEQKRARRELKAEEKSVQSMERKEEKRKMRLEETPEEREERLTLQRAKRAEKKAAKEKEEADGVTAETPSLSSETSEPKKSDDSGVEKDDGSEAMDDGESPVDPPAPDDLGAEAAAAPTTDSRDGAGGAIHMNVKELLESEAEADAASHSLIPPRVKARGKKLKFYPSPVPFDRHLSALEQVSLHDRIKTAVLGNVPSEGLHLIHGPPGTGKTRKLAEIAARTQGRIFACAPTNVGAANLYTRIVELIPETSLLMPPSRVPNGTPVTSQDPTARVVCSTISGRSGPILDSESFEVVLIDEAAQCMEPWIWSLLRSDVHTVIMAGDTHQLPSLVSQEGTSLNYGRSMMQRLLENDYTPEFLSIQKRMHPEIVLFPNKRFYASKLRSDYTPHSATLAPYHLVKVEHSECTKIGTSFVNRAEARVCLDLYNSLRSNFDSVVVISPYQAQTRELLAMGVDSVHTVDSFQGQEADAIIVSVVRENDIGFWSDYRRLNVALTRARHCLRVVGAVNMWTGMLKELADDARGRDVIV